MSLLYEIMIHFSAKSSLVSLRNCLFVNRFHFLSFLLPFYIWQVRKMRWVNTSVVYPNTLNLDPDPGPYPDPDPEL